MIIEVNYIHVLKVQKMYHLGTIIIFSEVDD